MDAWIGSGVQAPEIPRTERGGSMDGIDLQVLTFAGQETRPVPHPRALLPEEVCVGRSAIENGLNKGTGKSDSSEGQMPSWETGNRRQRLRPQRQT